MRQDGPPPEDHIPSINFDIASVADAIPKVELITKAGNFSPYVVMGKTYRVLPSAADYKERGVASWYGYKFHGRKTSNGEFYNMYGMTAAHKSLPIPSYVRVTNLENGLNAIVRVNDRGPFHEDRIIDLSFVAAKKLGVFSSGTADVEVEAIDPIEYQKKVDDGSTPAGKNGRIESQSANPSFAVKPAMKEGEVISDTFIQVAALSSEAAANSLVDRLRNLIKYPINIHRYSGPQILFKVIVGPVKGKAQIKETTALVRKYEGIGKFLVYQ
ncbi:MAG: rare lipoprotein A [Porticoccus sp.]